MQRAVFPLFPNQSRTLGRQKLIVMNLLSKRSLPYTCSSAGAESRVYFQVCLTFYLSVAWTNWESHWKCFVSHHCLLLATASLADTSFASVFIYLIAVCWLYNTEAKCHMVCKCLSSHVNNPPLYRDKKQLPEKILKPVAPLWHLLLTESTLARHSCASHTFASLPFVLGSYGK